MTIEELKTLLLLYVIRLITLDYFVIKKEIKQAIPKGSIKVLDLGCGLGYFADHFPRQGYLGIDIDPHSISLAKKLHPNYTFQVKDMAKLTIKTKFDLVFIIGVLHHLTDKQMTKSLSIIKTLMKKNGKVLIVEAIPPISKFNFIGKLLRSMDQGHYIRRTPDYVKIMQRKFDTISSKKAFGGFVDYAIFTLSN